METGRKREEEEDEVLNSVKLSKIKSFNFIILEKKIFECPPHTSVGPMWEVGVPEVICRPGV